MVCCDKGQGQGPSGSPGESKKCKTKMPTRPVTHLIPDRRTLTRSVLAGLVMGLLAPARNVVAQISTPTPLRGQDWARLGIDERELPTGMDLESAGTRVMIGEVAGTFRNSRDAAQLLKDWGWVGNAYRTYIPGPESSSMTPARLEISLHAFRSSTGAAYALPYFAHDRAVAVQQREEGNNSLLPCAATVLGDGSVTRFLRNGNLLVRVTVVMPWPADAGSNSAALSTATSLALAALADNGTNIPATATSC